MESVNSRQHQSFGFERRFIRALKKMALWLVPALLTTLAMPWVVLERLRVSVSAARKAAGRSLRGDERAYSVNGSRRF